MTGNRNCSYCDVKLGTPKRPYSHTGVFLGVFAFDTGAVCRRSFQPKEVAIAIEIAARKKGVWGLGPEIIAQPDASNAASVAQLRRTAELSLGSNVVDVSLIEKTGTKRKSKLSTSQTAEVIMTPRAVMINNA